MRVAKRVFLKLVRVHNAFFANNDVVMARRTRQFIGRVLQHYKSYATVERRTYVRYAGERMRVNSPLIDDALIGAHCRFKNRDQLRRLFVGFRIPAFFTIPGLGFRFNGEELMLLSIDWDRATWIYKRDIN